MVMVKDPSYATALVGPEATDRLLQGGFSHLRPNRLMFWPPLSMKPLVICTAARAKHSVILQAQRVYTIYQRAEGHSHLPEAAAVCSAPASADLKHSKGKQYLDAEHHQRKTDILRRQSRTERSRTMRCAQAGGSGKLRSMRLSQSSSAPMIAQGNCLTISLCRKESGFGLHDGGCGRCCRGLAAPARTGWACKTQGLGIAATVRSLHSRCLRQASDSPCPYCMLFSTQRTRPSVKLSVALCDYDVRAGPCMHVHEA